MTLAGLSLAYLKDRALNTALNVLLLALGVATLVILALFSAQLGQRFERDAQGIDLVVGAKGSPLQLILSSVYQVDVPTGNIPLGALDALRRDPGVRQVIPLALGDSFRGFRIVGTEPTYLSHYGAEIADGRAWAAASEVVIGSEVARSTGAAIGQRFEGSHGLSAEPGAQEHAERPFQVVGVLTPTGTVLDRLILTSVESVWDVHGIHHGEGGDKQGAAGDAHHAHDDHDPAAANVRQAGELEPEVTALLVSYRTPAAAVRLPNFINRQTGLQAAAPAVETARLLSLVGVGVDAMRAFAVLLMLTSALAIFVALYTTLRQREGDMALLRALGAPPSRIFGQVLLEGVVLAAAGALVGLALGHAVVAAAVALFEQLEGLGMTAWRVVPAEGVIVASALLLGLVAALIPAARVFRVDVAHTLSNAS
jgi:putative ABC transport system permease protein